MSLRDRFFSPSDVIADLQRVGARLLDPAAPEGERSHGAVTGSELFHRRHGERRPAYGGIFCTRIFGPTTPLRCACGAVSGEERAGALCERCGVLCVPPGLRDQRYGHVVVAGVLHPALVPLVAAALRLSADEVREIARGRAWLDGDTARSIEEAEPHEGSVATGPAALAAALTRAGADAALVEVTVLRAVPLPPPGQRPFLGGLGPAMVDPWIGPLNETWHQLVQAAPRQLRLRELAAPQVLQWHAQGMVQELFETVVAMTVSPPVVTRVWPEPTPPRAPVRLVGAPGKQPEDAGTAVAGLFFVDDERLLVQRPHGSWLVTRRGEVLARFPSCGRLATSVHGTRLRLSQWIRNDWDWFDQDAYWDAISGRATVAVLDLETGAYLDTYPTDLPLRLLEQTQPEEFIPGSVAPDSPVGGSPEPQPAPLRWGGDRPGVLATTRDGRYAWFGDESGAAILDLETGVPMLDPVTESEVNSDDPLVRLAPDAPDVRDESDAGETATAMGLTPLHRLRILHGTGVISDGQETLFRIDAMIHAAAFSPAADQVAIATDTPTGEEIVLISVSDRPAVVGRFTAPND